MKGTFALIVVKTHGKMISCMIKAVLWHVVMIDLAGIRQMRAKPFLHLQAKRAEHRSIAWLQPVMWGCPVSLAVNLAIGVVGTV